MRYTLFAILLLVAPRGAFALTWDFDDGSTYGVGPLGHLLFISTPHYTAKSSMASGALR